eukprot:CAMPEP_0206218748 /NCGR_PEP_ID=MMETSP0047_2-20121206/3959_1 /ASSEMBLY_ACC=CAM_ASM_000192 /TAXON_ID=195065 /ORGANISM="Chroomonas mesostigmatica_cf, Strain CCMP1168" /LENGTH=153 /DNA_ID=CAMNT_0053641261 /DNA_START=367 /DNA_END=823 /DNA_ORIENTATION=+
MNRRSASNDSKNLARPALRSGGAFKAQMQHRLTSLVCLPDKVHTTHADELAHRLCVVVGVVVGVHARVQTRVAALTTRQKERLFGRLSKAQVQNLIAPPQDRGVQHCESSIVLHPDKLAAPHLQKPLGDRPVVRLRALGKVADHVCGRPSMRG